MDQQTLVQKIEQFSADLSLFNRAVHGTETETVLLGGVPTPSYRKLVADVDARESAAAKKAIDAGVAAMGDSAAAAANSAAAAERSAQIADAGAVVVTGHAAAIELVAGNITAIQGAAAAASAAAQSASEAAASAAEAAAAVPENLVQRVSDVETKNTQQGTRLTNVETKNTQQDTRLTDAETALAGKANADLGNVDPAKVKLLLNRVVYETGAWAAVSSSNAIPMDDTIPQITEGVQVMAASITPKSANSEITVKVTMYIAGNGSNHSMAALFKDSGPNALESCLVTTSGSNYGLPIVMEKSLSLGDTSPHTFSVRMGPYSGSMYLNGNSSGRLFGGAFISSITIEESAA